jgi:hypothetical protein
MYRMIAARMIANAVTPPHNMILVDVGIKVRFLRKYFLARRKAAFVYRSLLFFRFIHSIVFMVLQRVKLHVRILLVDITGTFGNVTC